MSETFIAGLVARLPGAVSVVYHDRSGLPCIGERPILEQRWPWRVGRAIRRRSPWLPAHSDRTAAYLEAIRRTRAQVVVAQFGTIGVRVAEACRLSGVPLIVYFRGFDATKHSIVQAYGNEYQNLFRQAAAIFAVSHSIANRLCGLAADPGKIFVNPSGVDMDRFRGADPGHAPPVLLSVGRFTEKKGHRYTIDAFSEVFREREEATLRLVGDGTLAALLRQQAASTGVAEAVHFLGPQPHDVVAREMQAARMYVQHSVVASSGDEEGTPVAVMEAAASGLPVVATRHAGIVDVVRHGVSGYLVEEGDTSTMASCMRRLVDDPQLAGQLGRAGRSVIADSFTIEHSVARLWTVLEACVDGR